MNRLGKANAAAGRAKMLSNPCIGRAAAGKIV